MVTDVSEMQSRIIGMLKKHIGDLQISKETESNFEVIGTKPGMQGKKKVNGYYFSSVVPKPKDVRLYFFPIYTHKEGIGELPQPLAKCLKGKSCFHIKKMDEELESQLITMIDKGIELYKKDGLI